MATVGKIVGGGFPLAAVTGRDEIMAVYDSTRSESDDFVSQVGTLNGNHVACAAGLATLAELRKPGAYERLRETGHRLREALETLCREAEIPALTTGEDPTFDIYFMEGAVSDYRSTLANDRDITQQFNVGLLDRGVLKGWPSKFYVSLAHTDEDVDRTIEAFAKSIGEIRR
jgi:glutamate-1-semialdehyde 2,1-aminomutase